ncbi:Hypothetical protein CINCED_3A010618 [Cinara cedri]|uniref:Uncharacterized protein n=1 Tax=Cinara cedri TaxID=506608 RepID=A0A5E4N593_9HEMI|nr:Hypothetical protein CINCED_3A010618 [Cinara cedri]
MDPSTYVNMQFAPEKSGTEVASQSVNSGAPLYFAPSSVCHPLPIVSVSMAVCLPEDTAEHTPSSTAHIGNLSDRPSYIGGRNVVLSDVRDLLCGPKDIPSQDLDRARHDQIVAASSRDTQYYYCMLDDILCRKEQDKRIREAEARVNQSPYDHHV